MKDQPVLLIKLTVSYIGLKELESPSHERLKNLSDKLYTLGTGLEEGKQVWLSKFIWCVG